MAGAGAGARAGLPGLVQDLRWEMLYGRRRLRRAGDEAAAEELVRGYCAARRAGRGAAGGFGEHLEGAVGRYLPQRLPEVAEVVAGLEEGGDSDEASRGRDQEASKGREQDAA